ncbi:MAG TPA: DUF4345 family protein [Myxococcota bacterium]|nr:DUF4345 family protein [Myxococcota bacterium]
MSFAKLVLWFSALNWLAAGTFALALPATNASIIQLELGGIISSSDLRAVYGGLRVGIGCFLAWAASTGHLRPGLIAAAALFGGNVLGRLVSLVADGVPEPPGLLLLGFELFGVVLVGVALTRREVSAA